MRFLPIFADKNNHLSQIPLLLSNFAKTSSSLIKNAIIALNFSAVARFF
jgi:hypothetical protein